MKKINEMRRRRVVTLILFRGVVVYFIFNIVSYQV